MVQSELLWKIYKKRSEIFYNDQFMMKIASVMTVDHHKYEKMLELTSSLSRVIEGELFRGQYSRAAKYLVIYECLCRTLQENAEKDIPPIDKGQV